MAKPENSKQITMYVPEDVLAKVDEAARETYNKNNGRTAWIISAMTEKLARDAAIIADADPADQARVKEIVSSYEAVNETGKEWLHITAVIARGADDFRK